ncbi:MAG: SDR family NAD(P)-dependent oxidoreductase, partial [bacterium]
MEISFDSRIVLVTGASRGIGKSTAMLFAESGASVVVHYHVNKAAAQSVINSLPGKRHTTCQADIASPEDLKQMVSTVISRYGRIDILVNNAGIYEEKDMTGIPVEEFLSYWETTIRVNLTGPALLSNLIAREMI